MRKVHFEPPEQWKKQEPSRTEKNPREYSAFVGYMERSQEVTNPRENNQEHPGQTNSGRTLFAHSRSMFRFDFQEFLPTSDILTVT